MSETQTHELVGRKAVLKVDYELEDRILAEGTVVVIEAVDRTGVTVRTEPCPTCGLSIRASGIRKRDLSLRVPSPDKKRHPASALDWHPYPETRPERDLQQVLLRVRTDAAAHLGYALVPFKAKRGRFYNNAVEDNRVVAWTALD